VRFRKARLALLELLQPEVLIRAPTKYGSDRVIADDSSEDFFSSSPSSRICLVQIVLQLHARP
jgi:hypothetical protein